MIFRIIQNLLYLSWGLENDLDVVFIQPIPVCCSFYMEKWKRFSHPAHLVMVVCWDLLGLLVCLLIIFISFLSCPFFCKAYFTWLSFVYKCSLLETVKALSISELIVDFFVLNDDVIQHVSIFLFVDFLYI